MNNLEGWGGPNPESWYIRQEKLQKKIVKECVNMASNLCCRDIAAWFPIMQRRN